MSHRIRRTTSFVCSLTICIATLSCWHLKIAAAFVPEDSITEVVNSNEYLLDRIESEFEKLKLPSASASKMFSGEYDLVETILRSGDCDRAYTMMLKRKKSYLEPYCFSMALAGRSDELEEKTKQFQTNLGVRRRLRNEECSFEHLCEIPKRHGIALKHVVENNYKAAVAEYREVSKLARFNNEYDDVANSIAMEVFLRSGAKACIEVLEELSQGKKTNFRSMFRSLSIVLNSTDAQKIAELKQELLPDHIEVFLHELALMLPADSTMDIAQAKILVPFAISKIPELNESDAGRLRHNLFSSDFIDSEEKDRLSAECLQWLHTKPKGDQRSAINSISPWLLANGKLDQLIALALQYDGKDRFRYATVIRNAMQAAKHDFSNQMGEIVSHLPAPKSLYTSYGMESKISDILIESRQFKLAQDWIENVKDEKKKNVLGVKLEMYRDLLAKETLTAEIFYSEAKELIQNAKTTESVFYSVIGNDFLAETAERHGVKVALEIARGLPDEVISYRTSRANELVSALLTRKRFEDVLLVADLCTQEELSNDRFGLDLETVSLGSQNEWINRLGEKFQGNRHILRRQIFIAISNGDKARAFKLLKQKIERCREFTTTPSFVYAGWEQQWYKEMKNITARKGKDGSPGKEAITAITETICTVKGSRKAIDFIDGHMKKPKEKLRLYASIYSEFLGNYSTTIWMCN